MNATETIDKYLNNINTLCDDKVFCAKLEEMQGYAQKHFVPIIQPQTASLLMSVIKIKKPKNILEIGTATGFSGIIMLLNCNAKLTTIDINEKCMEKAEQNFADFHLTSRVKLCLGDAKDILENLANKFDFIFLDGPKTQYIDYLPGLIDLLADGGVLFADNVLFKGLVAGENLTENGTLNDKQAGCPKGGAFDNIKNSKTTIINGLREFNKQIANDKRLHTSILNVGDGVSISVKLK